MDGLIRLTLEMHVPKDIVELMRKRLSVINVSVPFCSGPKSGLNLFELSTNLVQIELLSG